MIWNSYNDINQVKNKYSHPTTSDVLDSFIQASTALMFSFLRDKI